MQTTEIDKFSKVKKSAEFKEKPNRLDTHFNGTKTNLQFQVMRQTQSGFIKLDDCIYGI